MIRRCLLGIVFAAFIVFDVTRTLSVVARQRTPIQSASALSGGGQSRTPLADGRWLAIGGVGHDGPVRTLSLLDPTTSTTVVLPAQLRDARAWHTATILPDGRILIAGGRGEDGHIVRTIERFDPATETLSSVEIPGAAPRAGHTATLLTDGRVLIVGGEPESGRVGPGAEIWNLNTQTVTSVRDVGRRIGHGATLLPDGRVLLSGGTDGRGRTIDVGEVFDPRTGTSSPPTGLETTEDGQAIVTDARPADGAVDVALDSVITLRMSHGVLPQTVSDRTLVLSDSGGPVATHAVAAEDGRLLFLWPLNALAPATKYQVRQDGAHDRAGIPAATASMSFTTVQITESPDAGDPEPWTPDPSGPDGWRTHRPPSAWQSLPALHAEPGVTAVAGQVLTLDGRPLRDVTLEIEGESTRTDTTGRFLLRATVQETGHIELGIDGRSASRAHKAYGFFEYGMTMSAGITTVLPFTIWMPRLDVAHEVAIPSPTIAETVVTTPYIPGLALHLPPQTTVLTEGGQAVTRIGITPIPVDRPPFPLAANVDVPVYFTIQPGGAYVKTTGGGPKGAWLVYPNYRQATPGQLVQFFHYDPEEKGWYVYGVGSVTPDGTRVVPAPRTRVYEFTGAMINGGSSPPAAGATPGGPRRGEPVDPSTGVFIMQKTDLYLPDVIPLSLTRVYSSGDNLARPFGRGITHPYALFLWSAQEYTEADLVLPAGGKIHYVRTTPGTGLLGAYLVHQESPSTSATPTAFYKSSITWNGRGWNLTLTDGTVYVFGENAPLQAIRDRYGNTVTITHAQGQYGPVTRVTSPNGRWISFAYDASGRIAQASDSANRTVRYSYDGNGNLATATDAEQGVTTYTYTSANQLASIKDPRNIVYLTNTYAGGRLATQTLADQTSTFRFDYTVGASGITHTDVTDPRGHIERLVFNADHYVVSDTEAVGSPEQRTTLIERQPGSNHVTATVDGLGRRTEFAYDSLGHVVRTIELAGTAGAVASTLTFEPRFFQPATLTDPMGHRWTASYDLSGRLTSVTDPLNRRTAVAMNAMGQITAVTDALQRSWQFSYIGGDLANVTDPAGVVQTVMTDSASRIIGATDPLGHTARFSWDKLDRMSSATDAIGGRTSFSYDGNGNVLTAMDALARTTRYTYDAFDRVATRTDPLSHAESRQYDGNDNLTRAIDRKGQTTTYGYDALDRLTLTTFDDGSTVAYAYDAGDRVTQIVDSGNGAIARTYDLFDRVTSESTDLGAISYEYDADGRRTSMTVVGQSPIHYEYDAADQLTSISQDGTAITIAYDLGGRRTSLTHPNGVVASYAHDAADRLTSASYTLASVLLGDLTYSYDAAGNRVGMGGSWARTGFPPALIGATYDEANRIASRNGRSYSYDANGNLASDGVTTYVWNARNLLTSMGGGTAAMFQYDAMGRRRTRTVSGSTTEFLYDGLNVAREQATGGATAHVLSSLGLDEPFVRSGAAPATLLTDGLGSIIALSDNSGAIRTQYTYDAFGGTTTTGAASPNAAQFTGRENDGTGLYFYRARYYSPELARFVSEDPLEFAGGDVNLYAYVGNRPTGSTDPLGLYNRDVHFDLTNAIGRQVGMCAADARGVAIADQFVDDNIWTNPMLPGNVIARGLYHFTTPDRREALRRRAFESGSLTAMGVYLHALQDSYSHQTGRKDRDGEPYDSLYGHAHRRHRPDDPRDRPTLWRRMSEQTASELSQFHERYPGCRARP